MPVKTKQTEADLQRAILAYLEARPDTWAMRCNAGKVKSADGRWITLAPKGVSDIIGWKRKKEWPLVESYYGEHKLKAVFLAIECKGPKGRVTEEQQAFLDRVNEAGGLGFVARSIDDVVKQLGRCP